MSKKNKVNKGLARAVEIRKRIYGGITDAADKMMDKLGGYPGFEDDRRRFRSGVRKFYSTGDMDYMAKVANKLWEEAINERKFK